VGSQQNKKHQTCEGNNLPPDKTDFHKFPPGQSYTSPQIISVFGMMDYSEKPAMSFWFF
jgi:hypothetical protein